MSIVACLPCFNGADTLPAAVASIRAQSGPVQEILVVDDGSTDASAKVAEEAGARVIRHAENLGRGAARATGMSEAESEYMLFCDAGIQLPFNFLERAWETMRDQNVAAVFGRTTSNQETVAHRWRNRHLLKNEMQREPQSNALLATGGALLRSAHVRRVGGFNRALRAGEDADLGRRLLAAGFAVVFDPSLELRSLGRDDIPSVLRRYVRWNAGSTAVSWREYFRLIGYSARVMAVADLKQGDFFCACVSLLCPHFQFWSGRRSADGPTSGVRGKNLEMNRCV